MAEQADDMAEQADVVVVGMGPGGEEAAGRLAEAGLSVVGVDERLVGGECPYWGCIPSKMMIRAANLLAEARRVPGMAGDSSVTPDWAPVAARLREATNDWDDAAAVARFEAKGGRFARGHGRLVGRGRVAVGDQEYVAKRAVVLASGTRASAPPIPGLADTPYWTNREAIEAVTLPGSLVVLGGGAIGVELAQAFARFGTAVTVVEAMERLLSLEEPEASVVVTRALTADGVRVVTGVSAQSVRHVDGRFVVSIGDEELTAERLLVATGRRTDLAALGVGAVGLDESARAVPVDDRLRVTDGVWAVGDLTGKGPFTHVAVYQAGIAVRDILGEPGPPADYRALPRVTFTDPEIGATGLTEAQARDAGHTVRTGVTEVPTSTRGWIHRAGNDGVIKLVADADRGVLLGATSAGPVGGEVLGLLTLAVHAGVPVDRLRHMIYAYPTFHRAVESALTDLG